MGVNGEALQLHAVNKKVCFYYKSHRTRGAAKRVQQMTIMLFPHNLAHFNAAINGQLPELHNSVAVPISQHNGYHLPVAKIIYPNPNPVLLFYYSCIHT